MTNLKTTKRALITSAVSLLLCFCMLLGTTYAWFTDSAVSKGNKIQAGKLDIELHLWTAEGVSENIGDLATPIFGVNADETLWKAQDNAKDTLWEPGKTQTVYLSIKNTGNLDLKYMVALEVTEATNDLEDYMEYAISPDKEYGEDVEWGGGSKVSLGTNATESNNVALKAGQEHFFALSVHMNEDATNEQMGGTIMFDIKVLAGQLASELDSTGEGYDENAMYAVANGLYIDKEDGSYVAMSTEGLSAVAALASEDDTITSVTYVTDEGEVEVPVVSDFASFDSAIDNNNEIVVLTSGDYGMPDGSDTTLINKELTVVGTEATVIDVSNVDERDQFVTGATLKFEGVTLNFGTALYMGFANCEELTYKDCVINGVQQLYGDKITFDGCTLNVEGDNYMVRTWAGKNVIFNDCTFNSDGKALLLYGTVNTKLTVNDCTFNDNGGLTDLKAAIEIANDYGVSYELIVNNTVVNGYEINDNGIATNTTLWANKNSMGTDKLNVVVDGVDVY